MDFVRKFTVALLAEGVDRNIQCIIRPCDIKVALLAEGVDRNTLFLRFAGAESKSPSSRRAWIEIPEAGSCCLRRSVALLAEGVDRNIFKQNAPPSGKIVALLAEGVDRNTITQKRCCRGARVALLAEGVDRNVLPADAVLLFRGRPPRGGRG